MKDSVALVTGGGTGIGRAVAVGLGRAGYRLVVAGRRRETLAETLAELGEASAERSLAVPTDVRDSAAVRRLFAETKKRFGRLDLLFNNAGVGGPATSIDASSDEQWHTVLETNLTGAFFCTREAFALMQAQRPRGGRIINNGSISAHAPRPGSAPYTAAKHGLTGLTKATALDGRAYDIACGQIDIGNAATELTASMAEGVPQADGSIRPEPRMDVDHVVGAVLYMASLPLDANVLFMTVLATGMPYIGRG